MIQHDTSRKRQHTDAEKFSHAPFLLTDIQKLFSLLTEQNIQTLKANMEKI